MVSTTSSPRDKESERKFNGKLSDKYVETSVFGQRPGKRKEKEKERNST